MRFRWVGPLLVGALSLQLNAQTGSSILDRYIQEGLGGNALLSTQQYDAQKAALALEQAKALFMPQVNFQMQYTLAAGGRTQPLPIGDLLNPVYATLNQLTQSNSFPSIENTDIYFLPNNFHDTKIRTTVPVLNRDLKYNKAIQQELIAGTETKIATYKQQLTKDIKVAYLNYLQAQKAVDIYKNALSLVRENLRVQEKLVKNDVATPAQVLKAKSEVSKLESAILDAENSAKNAAAYFNFLLNQPLDRTISVDSVFYKTPVAAATAPGSMGENRLELAQLESGKRALSLQLRQQKAYQTPKIGAFLDIGFQGFGFKVWDKQAYGLLGAQVDMPIYTAKTNKLKIQQTQVTLQQVQAQQTAVKKQIELQIAVAETNLQTAQKATESAANTLQYAREYYRLTDRRYREGQALQIELIDARTQLTEAELQQSLQTANSYIKLFELEYARQ